ncbi:MAG: putative metal-binding motif-containing protein, partial [Nanoarchaeota archaeon]
MKYYIYALILLFSLSAVSAADVAYVLEDGSALSQNIVGAFRDLDLDFDIIRDSQIRTTDFSRYSVILVVEDVDNKAFIPFLDKHAIFFDRKIAEHVWRGTSASFSTGAIRIKVTNKNHEVFEGVNIPIDGEILIYTNPSAVHYLRIKPRDVSTLAVRSGGSDAIIAESIKEINNKPVKDLFIGAIDSTKWNSNMKIIFKNSLLYMISDVDQDEDGFIFEEDCDDHNADIYPGADEVPYDGIDQDCDGFDLLDVDEDGYCLEGTLIQNKIFQCPLEPGNIGTDCDDGNDGININAEEILDDVDQNCVNDAPVLLEDIEDL